MTQETTNNPSRQIIDRWMAAVNTGDADRLLSLYHPEARLIPTFSNRILRGPDALADYFKMLCAREQLSISLHERTFNAQPAGNHSIVSGLYCWRFAVDEEVLSFEARFTYMLDTGAAAPILHHHSSQIPRSL